MSGDTPIPVPGCSGCKALSNRVEELEARLRELEIRLGLNSSNSSTPPSADPPGAPKPVVKTPTGRKPGGQPGHPGHRRERLPAERVRHRVHYVPPTCEACLAPLPQEAGPGDPGPDWHQVAELPEIAAEVTEHLGHARTCTGCGHVTRAEIPPAITARVTGPRLDAVMALFAGVCHDGKRIVQELVETVFAVPISLGTVCAREAEMSAALAAAHAEAGEVVRSAAARNVDETSWRIAGVPAWLWTAATATVAFFVIHAKRSKAGLKALLGDLRGRRGIVCSDRFGVYNRIARRLRQLCWAHLKRDFRKCVDRGGAAAEIGRAGLEAVQRVFLHWRDFREGRLSREGLQRVIRPIRRDLRAALERAGNCADGKAAAFAGNVLKLYPALWTFVRLEGVEPTNNHAERMLRQGVLWRKNSFGCHSEGGCRFVERMLTVVQTLRLQCRPVLGYLQAALTAHRAGLSAPALLTTN